MKHVRIPFKTTQLLLFALVIFGAGVLNSITLYHLHRYLGIFDRSLVGYHVIQEFHQELEASRSNLRLYVRHRDADYAAAFLSSGTDLRRLLAGVRRYNRTGTATLYEIRALENGLRAYREIGERVVRRESTSDPDTFHEFLRAERISEFLFRYAQRLMHIRLTEELATHVELRRDARLMGLGAFGGIFVVGALVMAFLVLLTRRITTPIRTLARAAQRMAHGDLEIGDVTVFSVEEINLLADAFNRMNHNIRSLVRDLKEKSAVELKNAQMERHLEHARFQQLQAQINPHFLFNNLNAISRAALFEQAPQSARLIQALAQLLRHTLGTSSSLTPLEQELLVVREYIHIQEFRFRERLRFDLVCDGDISTIRIPCLTVQPLVENAVQHGIEPQEAGGSVSLSILQYNGRIRILVEDSGIGMQPERLQQVLDSEPSTDRTDGNGIGIANVRERLLLMYHEDVRFDIESTFGAGTRVTIEIPNRPVDAGVEA